MDPERWERVQELFHRAVELSGDERSAFVREACGEDRSLALEVERMLAEDGREWLLDHHAVDIAEAVSEDRLSMSFEEFSSYRLLRVVGEGGMGVVYLAERRDLGNLVAIKLLRDAWLSPARRERFTAEQRTLAQFNHPSIARLYDASTLPDGTPWFVMEYVDGVPITEYCQNHKCSVEERLRLVRLVAEAVQYAHQHGVIHRDLKPSNILVKRDGSVRLVDFGIAKQLDAVGQEATHTRTAFRQMTTAYASPEQLRGEAVSTLTDVYSLGVVLYELLAERLPFDLAGKSVAEAERLIVTGEPPRLSSVAPRTGARTWWANLDSMCLTAMEKDPARRYSSVAAMIRDIDHYLNREPVEARGDSWMTRLARFSRRNFRRISIAATAAVLVAATAAVTVLLTRKTQAARQQSKTVAVLPFQNPAGDRSLDYLSAALPEEITRILDYGRHLTVRTAQSARKYNAAGVDLQKAGRQLGVDTIVSGRLMRAGDQVQMTLELTDVESNRLVWSDVFEVPSGNIVAMQAQVAAKTRRTMAPVLGVSEFVSDDPPQPKNEEAYKLYLEVLAEPDLVSLDPALRKRTMNKLERSVQLDPSFGPAWRILSGMYSGLFWFGNGGEEARRKSSAALAKAVEAEPDNVIYKADLLLDLSGRPVSEGRITQAQAYRGVQDLLRQRPDRARLHFLLSWILRDAGLLDESARECEASMIIDARDAGSRSCGITFLLRGDYSRAQDFLRLDPEAEISQATLIDVLVDEGKTKEVLERKPPQWSGYPMLLAYLRHRPAEEIDAMAAQVEPVSDPEPNYLSAAHLSYVGQGERALPLLKRAVETGYCAYPGMDSDPMLANARSRPGFAEIRAEGLACQEKFLRERERPPVPKPDGSKKHP
ncbi:MAG TPA: serine/threonine-protein kinase [Bryobacteraceae bacterium]|nr:serine/threonine-protein kinase [Bryobacteraceae bacterium]